MSLTILYPASVLFVGVVIAISIGLALTRKLRSKDGKAVRKHGDHGNGEPEIQRQIRCAARFTIHPLTAEDRLKYSEAWRREQSLFVHDPRAAVYHIETLARDAMQRRGYPLAVLDQNADDPSTDHRTLDKYRVAHERAGLRNRGERSIDELRRAMVSFLILFEDLLGQTLENRPIHELAG